MTPSDVSPAPVGLSDLGVLTSRGLAAFAARTARRAMAMYPAAGDDATPPRPHFDNAILYTESAARGEASELSVAELEELYAHADRVSETCGFAVFAAAHAARVGTRSIAGAADHTAHLELIASAFGATRVLYNCAGDFGAAAVTAALRKDFDALVGLALGTPGAAGAAVDPTAAGPLGPVGG